MFSLTFLWKKYDILKFWMPENVCFQNEIIKKQITVFWVGHEEELREKMQSKHICILQQLCGELRQCASPPRRRHHRGRTLAQLCYSLKFLNKMGQVLVKSRSFFWEHWNTGLYERLTNQNALQYEWSKIQNDCSMVLKNLHGLDFR